MTCPTTETTREQFRTTAETAPPASQIPVVVTLRTDPDEAYDRGRERTRSLACSERDRRRPDRRPGTRGDRPPRVHDRLRPESILTDCGTELVENFVDRCTTT
jgi:hypothetical protein